MSDVFGSNFKRNEFACNDSCGFDTVDAELLDILKDVREHFGKAVKITGPNRCPLHNQREGGASNSQHIYGRAADFKVADTAPEEVYAYLDSQFPDKYGIGIYSNRVHFDTRSGPKARWDNR
jgi:uncharacterized protein YcbK (DUF882 family)